jgi:cathepsin B
LDNDLIERVNSNPRATWKAGRNARFEGVSLDTARSLLGTVVLNETGAPKAKAVYASNIPTSFDARQQWPNCIHPIRDQQQCGSCWAFGATETLSDRFCIATGGKTNVILSPQDLVSCDSDNYGCSGGYLNLAWQFMQDTGVLTDACYPYTSGDGDTGTCKATASGNCPSKKGSETYYKSQAAQDFSNDVAKIQTEIMTHGPVEVAFDVYQDFFSYTSGVYTHQSGGLAGGHAVKMIGWGVTNDGKNTPYWIVANSWGTSWGQDGFFWILRGSNECGIEANVIAGLPATSSARNPIHFGGVQHE